jgi:hypothetical protein
MTEGKTGQYAARAWRQARPLELAPKCTEILSEKPKSSVYRLLNATRTGSAVIAKHCMHWGLRVERTVYEGVAPFLPVRMPRYYGYAEEDNNDWYWLFFEDVGNVRPCLTHAEHLVLAARWLACLHGASACEPVKSKLPLSGPVHFCAPWDASRKQLPERGAEYCRWTMQVGYEILLRARANSETVIRKHIEDILSLYDDAEQCWPMLERLCADAPRVIAHGDFVEKNLCIQKGTEDTLVAVDWESAGWSTPAIDLAVLHKLVDESILSEYCTIVQPNWPGVGLSLVRKLTSVGALFRALLAIYWEAHLIPYSPQGTTEDMQTYAQQLSTALAALESRHASSHRTQSLNATQSCHQNSAS